MTRAEFVAKVKENLTSDANRAGATTYVNNLIDIGMIDLQHYIERYRLGHKDVYEASDFLDEEFASRGELPDQCQIRDVYILRGKAGEITAVDDSADEITV